MHRKIFIAAMLAMTCALAAPVWALPLGQYRVYIGGLEAGYLGQSGAVEQRPAPSGAVALGVCRYRLIWHTNAGFDPRLCTVDEERTSLYPNCSANRLVRFPTAVHAGILRLNGGGDGNGDGNNFNYLNGCTGHDNNDAVWSVAYLVAAESSQQRGLGLTGVLLIDQIFDTFVA